MNLKRLQAFETNRDAHGIIYPRRLTDLEKNTCDVVYEKVPRFVWNKIQDFRIKMWIAK